MFGGKSHDLTCQNTLLIFHQTCDQLGIPIAVEKTVEPTTSLTFLGIQLDTLSMQMRLPQDKLTELRTQIQHSLVVKKFTLQELQFIIGSLNFVCQVVAPGRAFLRRLIDATIGIKHAKFKIRVSTSMRLDLEMWLRFLDNYNGVTLFPERLWVANDSIQFYTDSSGGSVVSGYFFRINGLLVSGLSIGQIWED